MFRKATTIVLCRAWWFHDDHQAITYAPPGPDQRGSKGRTPSLPSHIHNTLRYIVYIFYANIFWCICYAPLPALTTITQIAKICWKIVIWSLFTILFLSFLKSQECYLAIISKPQINSFSHFFNSKPHPKNPKYTRISLHKKLMLNLGTGVS